jgi:tetratricopeptide (TPR) repeat protein
MIKNESKLWEFLNKYCISKFIFHIQTEEIKTEKTAEFINGKFIEVKNPMIIEKGDIVFQFTEFVQKHLIFSKFYTNFTTNINRAIVYYPEIINVDSPEDFFNLRIIFIFQTMHILLITALEGYLGDLFKWISQNILISNLEARLLVKFLKTFNIRNEFLNIYAKKGNFNFTLSEILPSRMDFQQKKKCKTAYNLVGIDVVNISDSIWEKIYAPEGYIKRRNSYVHSDMTEYLRIKNIKNIQDFNLENEIEEFENSLMDIVKFVFYIEHQRFFRYPDRAETSTGLLDKFNYKDLDPLVKEIVVNNNLNEFFYFADYNFKEGNYNKAIEVYEVISQIRPEIIDVWYNLGLAFEKNNNLEKALESYQKAYNLDPNFKDLKKKLDIK